MKIRYVLTFLFTVSFISCIFSPDGENFVDVNKNVAPPELTNNTLDFENDTIFIWKKTQMNFDLSSSSQGILKVVVSYAGKTQEFGPNGTFQIDPLNMQEGTYDLEMKVYTHSGTGSLADAVEAEQFELSRKWVLIIINPTPPDQSKIKIATSIENGFLKFSWDKAYKTYFTFYKLSLTNQGLMAGYSYEFYDINITSFIDSLYVGGDITARLDINYSVGENVRVQTQVSYSYPITVNVSENVDSLTLKWKRNPFQHKTFYSANNGGSWSEIVADSSITMESLGFGGPISHYIGFKPLKQSPVKPYYEIYTSQSTFMTQNGQKYYNFVYLQGVNSYLLKYPMYVRRFNKDFGLTGSYDYPWTYTDGYSVDISNDDQKIYAVINKKFTVLNSGTLAKIRECNLPPGKFDSDDSYELKYLNDSLFIVGMRYYYALYNINTAALVDSADFGKKYGDSSTDYYYAVSSDGKYAAYCDKYGLKLYENMNNQELKLIYKDLTFHYNCTFDPLNPTILIANSQPYIYYFNCQTLQVERTLDAKYGYSLNVDPSTGHLLLGSMISKKLCIYDYSSDKILKSYNFRGTPFDYKLLNNTIFAKNGYHYKL